MQCVSATDTELQRKSCFLMKLGTFAFHFSANAQGDELPVKVSRSENKGRSSIRIRWNLCRSTHTERPVTRRGTCFHDACGRLAGCRGSLPRARCYSTRQAARQAE
ncbi:hypothetical protein XENORESO_000854 [Xenotaenia resolanae]|uniref:Uncharacterized protein n=1 Tax=Xenotaenia resolanae TaxID=208358 RepID=A0ABV0WI72_9TELE